MEPPLHREDWHRMKGWYRVAVDRAPPPARITLERITAERVDLYSYVPPPGENTPVSIEPFPVYDSLPTEDNIEWVVKRLQNNRSGGPSGMRAEHLKVWLAEARKKERWEVAENQENPTEGTTARPGETGREGMEESREKTPAEAYNW